jgi:hypothetical protein
VKQKTLPARHSPSHHLLTFFISPGYNNPQLPCLHLGEP